MCVYGSIYLDLSILAGHLDLPHQTTVFLA
jgi:hypothetical protein